MIKKCNKDTEIQNEMHTVFMAALSVISYFCYTDGAFDVQNSAALL